MNEHITYNFDIPESVSYQTERYGEVTFQRWDKGTLRRIYINAAGIRGRIGYIDARTQEVHSEAGNYNIPLNIIQATGRTPAQIVDNLYPPNWA